MNLWEPHYVAGRWPYWQCATPFGPYNFQAKDREAALRIAERERKAYESREDHAG